MEKERETETENLIVLPSARGFSFHVTVACGCGLLRCFAFARFWHGSEFQKLEFLYWACFDSISLVIPFAYGLFFSERYEAKGEE